MRGRHEPRARRCGHVCTALISRNEDDHTWRNDSWRVRGNERKEGGREREGVSVKRRVVIFAREKA